MKRYKVNIIFLVIGSLLFLSACAHRPKDDFSYRKNALVIDIKAENNLNTYNGQSHTVLLGLFELSDPNIFSQMLEQQGSVSKLLGMDAFGGDVVSRRKLIIQPGEHKQLLMDRVEGARYLGVVAGYYKPQQDKIAGRLFTVELDYKPTTIWNRVVEKQILVELLLGGNDFSR